MNKRKPERKYEREGEGIYRQNISISDPAFHSRITGRISAIGRISTGKKRFPNFPVLLYRKGHEKVSCKKKVHFSMQLFSVHLLPLSHLSGKHLKEQNFQDRHLLENHSQEHFLKILFLPINLSFPETISFMRIHEKKGFSGHMLSRNFSCRNLKFIHAGKDEGGKRKKEEKGDIERIWDKFFDFKKAEIKNQGILKSGILESKFHDLQERPVSELFDSKFSAAKKVCMENSARYYLPMCFRMFASEKSGFSENNTFRLFEAGKGFPPHFEPKREMFLKKFSRIWNMETVSGQIISGNRKDGTDFGTNFGRPSTKSFVELSVPGISSSLPVFPPEANTFTSRKQSDAFDSFIYEFRESDRKLLLENFGSELVFDRSSSLIQEVEQKAAQIKEEVKELLRDKGSIQGQLSSLTKNEQELKERLDINKISEQVIREISQRLKIESERRGIP